MRITGKGLILALAAILSLSALFAVACGGGNGGGLGGLTGGKAAATASKNQDNGSNNEEATVEPTSETDNGDNSGSTVSKTADDYASKVCNAVAKYTSDIQDIQDSTADMSDPTQMKGLFDQMVPLFKGLAKDLNKIKPPSDVKDWHTNMVTELNDAADLLSQLSSLLDKPTADAEAQSEMSDLMTQMNDMGDPFDVTTLPDEYQTAFDQNSDCQDLSNVDIFTP